MIITLRNKLTSHAVASSVVNKTILSQSNISTCSIGILQRVLKGPDSAVMEAVFKENPYLVWLNSKQSGNTL
jgi:hypothetical protein